MFILNFRNDDLIILNNKSYKFFKSNKFLNYKSLKSLKF